MTGPHLRESPNPAPVGPEPRGQTGKSERRIAAPDFDLAATLDSGQVFHWDRCGAGFAGLIDRTLVVLAQSPAGELEVETGAADLVRNYFALDHDLEAIHSGFREDDAVLRRAIAFCPGLRIIRQPVWECLATFITSSLKQVAHIRQISAAVRRAFGDPIPGRDRVRHAYPSPEAIARAGERPLRACGLGYRAPYLAATARAVADGAVDLDCLARPETSEREAMEMLCRLPGVGPKIASCVLLFGAGRLGAFPIDVWVDRVLRQLYARETRDLDRAGLARFIASQFGPGRGYAQQYLFHQARLTMPRRQPAAGGRRAAR